MKKLKSVDYLVVHCSATTPSMDIGKEEIDRWHRKRKMLMIGYHYVIRRDGVLEEGRELDEMGAHVRGWNDVSIGICMAGGIDENGRPENNYTEEQFACLRSVLYYLHNKNPKAIIQGHRDFPNVAKACPCFDVKTWYAKAHSP